MLPPIEAEIANLAHSPDLYPFQVDWTGRRVLLAKVNADFYRDAAFLDQRAFKQQPASHWMSFDELQARLPATQSTSYGLGWIFHMGHCGSTLMSRLIGEVEGVLSLREPLPLRDLASLWAEHASVWSLHGPEPLKQNWGMFWRLWLRRPAGPGLSIIKATSFCDLIAADWLERFERDRAVLIKVSPETYLRSIFVHEGYLQDIYGSARARLLPHLEVFNGAVAPLYDLSPGARVGLAYVCAALNQARVLKVAPERSLMIDFDAYLAKPSEGLLSLASFFGLDAGPQMVERILSGQVPAAYSKATEYPFGPSDRDARMREADQHHSADIAEGLKWIDELRLKNAHIDDALKRIGH